MDLTDQQKEILNCEEDILVVGGPGSGKTTVSILKASQIVKEALEREQKVLFLSFARATISRVVEAIEHEQEIPKEQKKRIKVETYHSFFWSIIKTHGYLVGLPRSLSVLTPSQEAIALLDIRKEYGKGSKLTDSEKQEKESREYLEKKRLAKDEGLISFDLFADFVAEILNGSQRIRELIAIVNPVIILDEFQDTSADQWAVIKLLGKKCRLIALADPEQRIYDWIGADPERLDHFREACNPEEFDLSTDNHRSTGTEIAVFGNDILKKKYKEKYTGISRKTFEPYKDQAYTTLVTEVLKARKRLIDNGTKDWSLAILVPTKKMTRLVSDALDSPPAGLPYVSHSAVIDMEAIILSAECIAFLMQPKSDKSFEKFIYLLRDFYYGKGGDSPTQTDIKEAERIQKAYDDYLAKKEAGKNISKVSILTPILDTYEKICSLDFIGYPDKDWNAIRILLEESDSSRLNNIAKEVRNLRLLKRGDRLRESLFEDWHNTGTYENAFKIVKEAFVQEHFSTTKKPETGVIVMNMHKAKGKQFDEVIIFEGSPIMKRGKIVANPDRIVRWNDPNHDTSQARQNLRVSVTRGKSNVTILTPKSNPCILLLNKK